jgi:hypothetical protein
MGVGDPHMCCKGYVKKVLASWLTGATRLYKNNVSFSSIEGSYVFDV